MRKTRTMAQILDDLRAAHAMLDSMFGTADAPRRRRRKRKDKAMKHGMHKEMQKKAGGKTKKGASK